jgi:hypothetical protein
VPRSDQQIRRFCRTTVRPAACARTAREVLSEEELTLLAAFPAAGRLDGVSIDIEEAAGRTGLSRGLAALGLELLALRGLA